MARGLGVGAVEQLPAETPASEGRQHVDLGDVEPAILRPAQGKPHDLLSDTACPGEALTYVAANAREGRGHHGRNLGHAEALE